MAVAVLDASVLIAFRDPADAHHHSSVAALVAVHDHELVVPVSAYAEILVEPYRHGARVVARWERFLDDFAMRIEPISRDIGRRAAVLRAGKRSLALPDALVIATGDVLGADRVLTADASWKGVSRRVRVV